MSESSPDPPLSLPSAEEKFSAFLSSQNDPSAIFWVFPGHVLIDRERRCWVRTDRSTARQFAALSYKKGLEKGLGIWLRAICASEKETFATVFVPEDEVDAQYHLMGL